jgi:hypothetical protein
MTWANGVLALVWIERDSVHLARVGTYPTDSLSKVTWLAAVKRREDGQGAWRRRPPLSVR